MLRQWDMSRAVPRHVRDVTVFKGDILTLCSSQGRVFTSGVDGSLRCSPAAVLLEHCTERLGCGLCCLFTSSSAAVLRWGSKPGCPAASAAHQVSRQGQQYVPPVPVQPDMLQTVMPPCRPWTISKTGELTPAASRDKAHRSGCCGCWWLPAALHQAEPHS